MQVVLIGGAQRSGTTLLQTLLANALGTSVLSEAHIFCDLLTAFKRAKSTPRKTAYYYKTEADLLAFFRECVDRHIETVKRNIVPASALVLKDPNLIQVDAEAAAVLPNAIRIVCLRDPRDIAASFLRIGEREKPEGAPGKYRRRDIDFIGKKILGAYSALMQDGGAKDLHLVRYEDVVVRPEETLAELARATGLALSLGPIDKLQWLEAESRHDPSWITELEEQGPSPASVGAYRTVMRPNEIALTEEICAPVMAWAGYESSFPGLASAGLRLTRLPRNLLRRMRGG